jgi:predicted DsbA family dithiol-disulfide isomerase
MNAAKRSVVFYHSMVCPRCRISGIALSRVLRNHPDVELTKVEFLSNMKSARAAGVRAIPTLVAEGRSLTGFLLTPGRIEQFLNSLGAEPG